MDDEIKSLKPEDVERLEIEVDELEELHRKIKEKSNLLMKNSCI